MIDIITQGKLPEVNVEPVQVFVHFMHNVLSSGHVGSNVMAMLGWASSFHFVILALQVYHSLSQTCHNGIRNKETSICILFGKLFIYQAIKTACILQLQLEMETSVRRLETS